MVGFGAYGKVFAAWLVDADGRNGRKIALKEVEVVGKKAGMVEREISILSALTHPHIIGLLGSERTETMLFILMEFAAAGSLARFCAGRLPAPCSATPASLHCALRLCDDEITRRILIQSSWPVCAPDCSDIR